MDVFRLAHDLAVRAHQLTTRFPAEERGSLVALLRRASAAVPAQLAAGSSRWDRVEYRSAVTSARDAAAETRYFLLLIKDLGHLSAQDCDEMRDGYASTTSETVPCATIRPRCMIASRSASVCASSR